MPSKGQTMSPEYRAALSKVRKGKPATPGVLAALVKGRAAASNPVSRAKQAASLSLTMKGRERSPSQIAVFDVARDKAHSLMLGNVSPGLGMVGLYATLGASLRERDGDLCQLCLTPIDFDLPLRTPWSRSVDHIIPTRAGGNDELENLWLSHTVCNQRKGARHHGRADGSTDAR